MRFEQDIAGAVPRPVRVTPVRVTELAELAGGVLVGPDLSVTGVSLASDLVRPGDLFVGVPGRRAHGADFAAAALDSGALAVLTDAAGRERVRTEAPVVVVEDVRASVGAVAAQVYGRPSHHLNVMGVTGTSGKTTTTFLIRAGLRAVGRPSGLIGTVASFVGEEVVKTGFTTPEAPDLQALLAVMRERGTMDVAMEVSSHALALGRADAIEFATAAFTNLSQDHLDFHADMEDYFAAKARLFEHDAWPVVVVDDEWGRRLARMSGPATTTVSTTGLDATWTATGVAELPGGGTRFRVLGPQVDLETYCRLPGQFNVANAVLALAVLDHAGVPAETCAAAVAEATVPGRMERVEAGQPFLAVVDYSHKPAAIDAALRALRGRSDGRLIVVLGGGGDRDRTKRPVMGEIAARSADLLIVTDDNPRGEEPAAIRAEILAGARQLARSDRGEVREVGDRGDAIAAAVAAAGPDDVVLVAGKGHEQGQEIAGITYPFDDREVLRAAILAASG